MMYEYDCLLFPSRNTTTEVIQNFKKVVVSYGCQLQLTNFTLVIKELIVAQKTFNYMA